MKKILVLGAGMVSKPLVRFLLDQPDFHVTVASRTVSKAEALVGDHPDGKAMSFNINNNMLLGKLVKNSDIVISLLPYTYHIKVAKACLKHGKHMVSTSYISKEMAELDEDAKKKDVILLNEIGLDPGIDHMSAMKIIHEVENSDGKIIGFHSYCGGLPAPDANDNPFGYKFSWSPRGVLMAGKNNARFLKDGEIIEIDGKDLFDNYWQMEVPSVGRFEGYPNRDSLPYIDKYNIVDTKTILRGTLRTPGWCSIIKKFAELGLLDETLDKKYAGLTYKEFMAVLAGDSDTDDVEKSVADKLGIDVNSQEIKAMEWLGLFEDIVISEGILLNPMDILSGIMQEKMPYKEGERDMIILYHVFDVFYPHNGRKEKITATLVEFGIPGGDSAMARTVSLPAAIAVKLILNGNIRGTGVRMPVDPEIYLPVLEELEKMGIKFDEQVQVLETPPMKPEQTPQKYYGTIL